MASLPSSMEHINRAELYTSLPARIAYLHSFLEFGPDDVAALIDGHSYIKTVVPAIVNMVYKKLLRYDITARTFKNRDSRNEEDPEEWPRENDSQIQHRKLFLRWYLTKLNSDPTKIEYWEYLDKVGLMHVGQGRKHPLHVDYVFLGACLGYIQDAMFEAILSHPRLRLERKIAIVKAIGKVIWIQNDLLAKWHTFDGQEYLDDGELSQPSTEEEGCLRGKKILGDDVSMHSSSSGHTSSGKSTSGKSSLGRDLRGGDSDGEMPMACPFSGMRISSPVEEQRAAPPSWPGSRRRSQEPARPSGIPHLHVSGGRVVGKEKVDWDDII